MVSESRNSSNERDANSPSLLSEWMAPTASVDGMLRSSAEFRVSCPDETTHALLGFGLVTEEVNECEARVIIVKENCLLATVIGGALEWSGHVHLNKSAQERWVVGVIRVRKARRARFRTVLARVREEVAEEIWTGIYTVMSPRRRRWLMPMWSLRWRDSARLCSNEDPCAVGSTYASAKLEESASTRHAGFVGREFAIELAVGTEQSHSPHR